MDATLFIVSSSVLSVFSITKAKDENGHEIPVSAATSARNGLVAYVCDCHARAFLGADMRRLRHPEEFQCSITPRDEVAKDLILASSLS